MRFQLNFGTSRPLPPLLVGGGKSAPPPSKFRTKNAGLNRVKMPKNGTLSVGIQKLRPLFHANIPPKWWNGQLDICFMRLPLLGEKSANILKKCTFFSVLSHFSLSTDPKIEMQSAGSFLKYETKPKHFWASLR